MASKRALRRRSCRGKAAYTMEDRAYVAAEEATKRAGRAIRHYLCNFCHRYHIGRPKIKGGKRRLKEWQLAEAID